MTFLLGLADEATHVALPLPTWGYAVIAGAIFTLLGFVTFSFRDVYHRHSAPDPVSAETEHK